MTYHMAARTRSKSRKSLDFTVPPDNFEDSQDENLCPVSTSSVVVSSEDGRGIPWPRKLWEIASDPKCDMIVWTEEGTGISIDDVLFEMSVMEVYPGFVQLPTFLNLRRQMRAYSFTWKSNTGDRSRGGGVTFSHPYFIRNHPELLPYVVTKRKSRRECCNPPPGVKKFAQDIQEANRWDLPLPAGLEMELSSFEQGVPIDFSVPVKKTPRTSGQLIQKAAKICEIPGSCSPLVRDFANHNASIDIHTPCHPMAMDPAQALPMYSDYAKGGYWPEVPTTRVPCDIPVRFWNDASDTEAVPLPPSTQYQQQNAQGPYPYYPYCDPYGYYQYPHPNMPNTTWANYEHSPGYFGPPPSSSSNTECTQGEPPLPLETSGQYPPVPYADQVPQFGYYNYPGHVTNVTDSVETKGSPKVEPECTNSLSPL